MGCLLTLLHQVSFLLVNNLIWDVLVNKFLAIEVNFTIFFEIIFSACKNVVQFMQVVFVPVLIGNFYMSYILFLILLVFYLLNLPILCGLFYEYVLGFVKTCNKILMQDMFLFSFFLFQGLFLVSH